MKLFLLLKMVFLVGLAAAQTPISSTLRSPDGKLEAVLDLDAGGVPHYLIRKEKEVVLERSKLGLVREDADFSKKLIWMGESSIGKVADDYEILTAKRRKNAYRANEQVFHLKTATGARMDIIFRVSNEGVAFRYFFPEVSPEIRTLKEETTSFCFVAGTKAWLQPMQVAKSGWARTNPAYEEFYEKEIAVGTPSPAKNGWVYPALLRSGKTWLLVSEGTLPRTFCATHLREATPEGEYGIAFADPRETMDGLPVNPASRLPWLTPWRLIVVGSLKTIAESTLGIDLADRPSLPADDSIQPGKAAWSWPLLGDKSANFETQEKFIDYAAAMGWRYCLIDAFWDKQIGYEKIQQLATYARSKQVGILLWYNSNGKWNAAPQTPKDRLLTHESRLEEFTRLKAMGIKGIKADFFGGDGRPVIAFYHDILEDAAPFGLLMNFHGTTLPRGLQRTYPHLMTAEAIRGEEYITFEQKTADQEPTHAAMLPFTRNVFDPMDFTPVVLGQLPGNKQRRTTSGFELALSVLFTSGIQHYAEIPETLEKVPGYVRDFLKNVPEVWDDTKFIDGYPGKFAVIARRGNKRWYLAGINAESAEKSVSLDLSSLQLKLGAKGSLIEDGGSGNLSFKQTDVQPASTAPMQVTIPPTGGFVMTIE